MDMVVGALSGMVDALPGKLGELLEQEYALLTGVRGDVGFLQKELNSMRAAIRHCESLDHPDGQTTAWIGRVRELAYDIEDWVDLFAVRVDAGGAAATTQSSSSSSGVIGWLRCCANKVTTMPARHVIANELRDLKDRVVELSDQRNRYSCVLPVPAASRSELDPRLAAYFVEPGSLVGLDGPVGEVSKILMDGKAELKIVSIVGMAGAGKTTLANEVCRRLQEQNSFDCHAFVSVGQKPESLDKIFAHMLSKLGCRHQGGEDIGQLINRLREFLQQKRYLIVVDDLWKTNDWTTIRCCFPENNLCSRIITTTRKDTLARYCSSGSGECVYKTALLSDADAKTLFLKKVFGSESGCPQHLEDVSAQILRRCGGLSLAVVTRAGMLASKQSRDEWERFGLSSLCSSQSDGVKQILNLSYNDLESQMRTCLLYLSIFPQDSEVDTGRLVRRWIAEGFVSGEETARNYIIDLISRNLVEPLHLNHDGSPRYCRVHPVIHDFIVCKSMEENFATLVDAQDQHVPSSNHTIRRLSLQNSSKDDQAKAQRESTDLSHARSITVFGHSSAMPSLTDLKVVRVLDLDGCDGLVCLDGLCKLVMLRYLSLRGTGVQELPETICELKCLETLDVASTKVKELPSSIVKLQKLKHLIAGNVQLPGGIAKMDTVQTLSCAVATKRSVNIIKELSELANLRKLELYCDDTGNRITFHNDELKSVTQLCIRGSSPSMAFELGALPMVQVLELKFGLANESSGVSGIEHLLSLKQVLVEFSQNNAGAKATVDAVRKAAEAVSPNHPEVTVTMEGKSY